MIYFLWLIFLLFLGQIIYMIFFEKPEKSTRGKRYFVRNKTNKLRW